MTGNVVPFAARPATGTRPAVTSSSVRTKDRAVYTVREVAALLSLSLGSTYALVRSGDIPAIKLGGRWVIPKKRFHVWLDSCTVPAEGGPEGRA